MFDNINDDDDDCSCSSCECSSSIDENMELNTSNRSYINHLNKSNHEENIEYQIEKIDLEKLIDESYSKMPSISSL